MRASASLVVERHGDRDVVAEQRCAAPFSIRQSGKRILLAASAAAPVGGDELELAIRLGPHARADVGSVAATLVYPGPSGEPSSMRTMCDVGDCGHLDMQLEPTISVQGSDHSAVTRVRLAPTATCRVVEEAVLGRAAEPAGHLALSLRVERGGRPLVHHDERFGPGVPGARSSVSVGAARYVLTAVVVGPPAGESAVHIDGPLAAAWLPVANDAGTAIAVGPDRPSTLRALARLRPDIVRFTSGAAGERPLASPVG